MRKVFFFIFFAFTFCSHAFTQDSCGLRITLLTCSPGTDLYSTFGHTALRVQNPITATDEVFNYGTFEFSPDFYVKFIRGKLLYALAIENFSDFIYSYQAENRSVVEQEVLMSCAQKQALYKDLHHNAREENRYYQYDFLLDNCTTRAGEMIAKQAGGPVSWQKIIPEEAPTFRNLLHVYLNKGQQYWSKLGIDLLLGSRIDRKVTNKEAMFLPDNLMKAITGASVYGTSVATKPQPVLTMPSPLGKFSLLTPGIVLTLFFAGIAVFSFLRSTHKLTRIFDFSLFLLSGLIGFLLLFMWFCTDHWWCGNNYNLLWALPSNVAGAFFIAKQKHQAAKYFRIVSWIMGLLLIMWFFLPQQLNNAFLPVVLVLMYRSWALSKNLLYAGTPTHS